MTHTMTRVTRAEVGVAFFAAGLALLTAIYLIFSLFGQRQICYGVQADRLVCQPVSFAAAERPALVIITILAFYFGGAAGAWLHARAKEPTARSAAFGLLCTCAIFLLCIVVPALNGSGLFLAPSMLLMLIAALLGLVALIRGSIGARARATSSPQP